MRTYLGLFAHIIAFLPNLSTPERRPFGYMSPSSPLKKFFSAPRERSNLSAFLSTAAKSDTPFSQFRIRQLRHPAPALRRTLDLLQVAVVAARPPKIAHPLQREHTPHRAILARLANYLTTPSPTSRLPAIFWAQSTASHFDISPSRRPSATRQKGRNH